MKLPRTTLSNNSHKCSTSHEGNKFFDFILSNNSQEVTKTQGYQILWLEMSDGVLADASIMEVMQGTLCNACCVMQWMLWKRVRGIMAMAAQSFNMWIACWSMQCILCMRCYRNIQITEGYCILTRFYWVACDEFATCDRHRTTTCAAYLTGFWCRAMWHACAMGQTRDNAMCGILTWFDEGHVTCLRHVTDTWQRHVLHSNWFDVTPCCKLATCDNAMCCIPMSIVVMPCHMIADMCLMLRHVACSPHVTMPCAAFCWGLLKCHVTCLRDMCIMWQTCDTLKAAQRDAYPFSCAKSVLHMFTRSQHMNWAGVKQSSS